MEGTAPPEKVRALLVEALKTALAAPHEVMLVRSGKLPGLFQSRTGVHGEAIDWALEHKFFEVVRQEDKGKIVHEYARIAPAGLEFLHACESPRAVLSELREALAVTRAGVPVFLEDLRQEMVNIGDRLAKEVAAMTRELDALSKRIEGAIRRADTVGPGWPEGATDVVPWAISTLAYLDKRRETGPSGDCPLPELFSATQRRHNDLTIAQFHEGLRRLVEFKAIQLKAYPGSAANIPEPEYALPDGKGFLYFAVR
jgi:hypothetical protein